MKNEEMGMLDAFCALSDIGESDLPKIREGKSFDVMNSQAMDAAKNFRDNDVGGDELEVVDVNADDMEHVLEKKEYVGQIILSCKKCHGKKFIDMDKLVKSDDDTYNVDDECPHCHVEGVGYEIVGQVGEVEPQQEIEPEAVDQEVVPEEQEPEPLPAAELETETDAPLSDLPELESEEDVEEQVQNVEETPAEEIVEEPVDDDEKDGMETDTHEDDDSEPVEKVEEVDDSSDNYFKDFDNLGENGFNDEVEEEPEEEPKKKLKLAFREDLAVDNLQTLIEKIVRPESIKTFRILDDAGDVLYEGGWDDLTREILNSRVLSWGTEDSMLVLNADSDVDSYEPPYAIVADVLEDFDSVVDNITIFDESGEEDVFTGSKKEALDLYGDLVLLSIEAPAILSIVTDNNIEPYSVDENKKVSALEEDIFRLNNLSARKVDNPKCDEYWIHESLENGEDLDLLFQHYVKGSVLEAQFKKMTGYRDAVDEAYDLTEAKARNDDPDEALETAKEIGRVNSAYSVVYGYRRNGKFYSLSEPIICRDQKEHLLAYDLVNAKYHAFTVDAVYARQFTEALDINTSSATKIEVDDNSAIISSEDNKIKVESDDGANVQVNDDGSVEVKKNKDEEEPENECIESVKDRSGLAQAIRECKENNIKYSIKRSTKEGYRYDLIKENMVPVKNVEAENGELARTDTEIEVMNKIRDISKCIADNIKKYYNIEADPELIVADILQDLSLISGDIKPEQLKNTPINNLTKSMYQSYTDFYDVVDEILSMFTGQSIHTTPEQKLKQAVRMLDSEMFSPTAIEKGIASDKFIDQVRSGALPYIPQDQIPMLEEKCSECEKCPDECDKEESEEDKEQINEDPCDDGNCVDMDIEKFQEELNQYFDEAYEDTVLCNIEEGYIDQKGNILLEGVVRSEEGAKNIEFTLIPENKINEGVEKTVYKVANNLSEEKFEFEF